MKNDGLDRDPFGEFLKKRIDELETSDVKGLRRGMRPAPAKIAGLAAGLVILVACVGFLAGWLVKGAGPGPAGREPALVEKEPALEKRMPGRVALVQGEVFVVREGSRSVLSLAGEILPGDVVETGSGAAVGFTYPAGHALVLGPAGSLEVRSARSAGVRVRLSEGLLAAHVVGGSVGREDVLRVEGSNAQVMVRSTVFTVTAERKRLSSVAVSEGEVEVVAEGRHGTLRLGSSSRLDLDTWSVEAGEPDRIALDRLALISDWVPLERSEPCVEEPEVPDAATHEETSQPVTVVGRIREALDAGDVDAALALVEQHSKKMKGAGFLQVAGETYRQAGRWEEAAECYLGAAEAGGGKNAERAYIRAVEIYLRKLGSAGKAAEVLDLYMKRFPGGSHLDEALYLGGLIQIKREDFDKAKGFFRSYLAKYPSGPQAIRAHLALAKIYARKKADCKSALVHIDAVLEGAPGSAMAETARKISARCNGDAEGGAEGGKP